MMPGEGGWTLLGVLALLISNVGLWMREWRLARQSPNNGRAMKKLDEVKSSVKELDGKTDGIKEDVAAIKTAVATTTTKVENMTTTCKETRQHFGSQIAENQRMLVGHLTGQHSGEGK